MVLKDDVTMTNTLRMTDLITINIGCMTNLAFKKCIAPSFGVSHRKSGEINDHRVSVETKEVESFKSSFWFSFCLFSSKFLLKSSADARTLLD